MICPMVICPMVICPVLNRIWFRASHFRRHTPSPRCRRCSGSSALPTTRWWQFDPPDAIAGRRGKPTPSPVAQFALDAGIPVLRPARPNAPEFVAELAELAPECCAVVAYGALLGTGLLGIPRAVGSTCTSRCCRRGGGRTGPGRHRCRRHRNRRNDFPDRTRVGHRAGIRWLPRRSGRPDTAGDLLGRLAVSGRHCWRPLWTASLTAPLTAVPQSVDGVSVAPKVSVEQARVRWELPAHVVERRIRSVTPAPGAWTTVGDCVSNWGRWRSRQGRTRRPQTRCRPGSFGSKVSRAGGHRFGSGAPRPRSAAGQEDNGRRGLAARRPTR